MVRKKATRRRRREWDGSHELQLRTGWAFLKDDGWPGVRRQWDPAEILPDVLDDIRRAWRKFGPAIMEAWDRPGRRPWAWWLLDSPEQRDPEQQEQQQLFTLGQLDAEELARVEAEAVEADRKLHASWWAGLPFRRDWKFWQFVADELRDETVSESQQLIAMGALTACERMILDDPDQATRGTACRTRYHYLPRAEREALGIHHADLDDLPVPASVEACNEDETPGDVPDDDAGEDARILTL
jgi:hypothetical protein